MGLELTTEILTSPMAGLFILAFSLFGLASYFKTRLDAEKAGGELREKEWQNRFDKQGESCKNETEKLRQEIKEIHRQYVTMANEVAYLKGFYERRKHNSESIQDVETLLLDSMPQGH